MLTVNYSEDESLLNNLYDKLELHEHSTSGINAVLFEEDVAIGLCKMVLTDNGVEIIYFKVADESADAGVEDFFFRTVLFKLSKTEVTVLIKCSDERIKQFGFVKSGEYMAVDANDIKFPSACGHGEEKAF